MPRLGSEPSSKSSTKGTATDTKYWVGFNIVPGIGPARLKRLIDYFGDAEKAWRSAPMDLARSGLDRKSLQALLAARDKLDLDAEMSRIKSFGARVVTLADESYPRLLREIGLPPPVLYFKGTLTPADDYAVAVVGTRHVKTYGREVTRYLSGELARNKITVVSGLALGIDAVAHQAAMEAGGRTIAVLGSGLDVIYPSENTALSRSIVGSGALVTEYPLGTKPDRGNFPARNRIISGLSLGTLVTQAGEKSGALITAYHALEQGREVFAVPGSMLDTGCSGTNQLIQRGEAKLVLKAADVMEELNLSMVSTPAQERVIVPGDATERELLKQLSDEPVHVDEIARAAALPISQVTGALTLMELKGLVRQSGGMNYVLAHEAGVRYIVD